MGKYKMCFTSSFYCTLLERESCAGEMAVIGGVIGVMSLVIVSLVTVLLTLICKR